MRRFGNWNEPPNTLPFDGSCFSGNAIAVSDTTLHDAIILHKGGTHIIERDHFSFNSCTITGLHEEYEMASIHTRRVRGQLTVP